MIKRILAITFVILIASIGTTLVHSTSAQSAASKLFLPMVITARGPMRGTAGGYTDGTSAAVGAKWVYNWDDRNRAPTNLAYEVVNMIRPNSPYSLTVDYAGEYFLAFNEPDNSDPNAGDNITPAQGATLLHTIATNLPSAKLICCNTLFSTTWMDAMLVAYQSQYGESGLNRLAGVSYHDYATLFAPQGCVSDTCIVSNWVTHAQAWRTWLQTKQGAYPMRKIET